MYTYSLKLSLLVQSKGRIHLLVRILLHHRRYQHQNQNCKTRMKQNNINKATDLGVSIIVIAIAVDQINHFTKVDLVLIFE